MEFRDYYSILGLIYPSAQEDIKNAYRRLSLKWHPDRNPGVDTSGKMIDINEAYYILNNPEMKNRYDMEYIKYQDFIHVGTLSVNVNVNKNQPSSHYKAQDVKVEEDINNAHKMASELVAEFLKSFHKVSKDAAKGSWKNMVPYIMGGLIFSFLVLILQTCE